MTSSPAATNMHRVLVFGEQAERLALLEVGDALRRRHEIVRFEHRDALLAARDVHPGDLEVRVIHAVEHQPTADEALRSEPRLDDQHASGIEMVSHAVDGSLQILHGQRVADRPEQARDDVERIGQSKIDQRAFMKRNTRAPISRNLEHLRTVIESFHPKVVTEVLQMPAGSARHVEQAGRVGHDTLQDLSKDPGRRGVVLVTA